MNKKQKFLVIDVETANSLDDPLVYDVGYAVTDKDGNIYLQEQWVIWDIFKLERDLMRSCYYAQKIPLYLDRLKSKETKYIDLWILRLRIRKIMEYYNINTVCAYNAHFDIMALNCTLRYVTKSKLRYFFPYGTQVNCIWNMACQAIYSQRKFVNWALAHDYVSDAGNIKTSAEIGKRYIDNNLTFCEQHMGLDDVLIEITIMVMCYKKHQKIDKNINRLCWRIPTTKYKEQVKEYLRNKKRNEEVNNEYIHAYNV